MLREKIGTHHPKLGETAEGRSGHEPDDGVFWLLSVFNALLTAGPSGAAEKST